VAFREQLQSCLEKLPEKSRDFLRRLLNLETADEIEAATGIKKTRIYQIKHEIGKQLAGCMEQGS
jgi:DNA-directed RNA polymerase sigma subunit (sigma70/sigma32)